MMKGEFQLGSEIEDLKAENERLQAENVGLRDKLDNWQDVCAEYHLDNGKLHDEIVWLQAGLENILNSHHEEAHIIAKDTLYPINRAARGPEA